MPQQVLQGGISSVRLDGPLEEVGSPGRGATEDICVAQQQTPKEQRTLKKGVGREQQDDHLEDTGGQGQDDNQLGKGNDMVIRGEVGDREWERMLYEAYEEQWNMRKGMEDERKQEVGGRTQQIESELVGIGDKEEGGIELGGSRLVEIGLQDNGGDRNWLETVFYTKHKLSTIPEEKSDLDRLVDCIESQEVKGKELDKNVRKVGMATRGRGRQT